MGVGYMLVNHTKRQMVGYLHVPVSKAVEIAGHPAASAITTWYMLENTGDQISFVTDTYGDWPFEDGSREDLTSYADVTSQTISELIDKGVLQDYGHSYEDPDEPEVVYERDLRNVWWSNGPR